MGLVIDVEVGEMGKGDSPYPWAPETNSTLKTLVCFLPFKKLTKRKGEASSKHPFSGANLLLVSGAG